MPLGGEPPRRRLCARVPISTVLVAALLVGVYLFVQDGLTAWTAPISIPYRAWGYQHLRGMLIAPFAHISPGHLTGNLVGLVVFGTLLEATVGHYPTHRGAVSFQTLQQNPWIRAVLVGPAVIVLVGIGLSLIALGPVIGFSSVVFWLMGVLVVLRPILAVIGLLITDAVRVTYLAVVAPVASVTAGAQFVTPWFAEIALQAHAVGLLIGVLTGIAIRSRGHITADAPASYVGAGVVLMGIDRGLWAVFFYEGGGTYVLYRALGVVLVATMALVVAAAVRGDPRARALAVTIAIALAGVAVPYNVVPPAAAEGTDRSLGVGSYSVSYGESVPDRSVDRIPIRVGPLSTAVTTSGVIVTDRANGIWTTAVSADELAFEQRAQIPLAVDGQRVQVKVVTDRWQVLGNDSAYRVRTTAPSSVPLFESPMSTAAPRIADQRITLVPTPEGFDVRSGGQTRRLPAVNETVQVGAVVLRTQEQQVVAEAPGVEVVVFTRAS